MSSKTRELIYLMLKQQDRMRLIYKNISVIDGQYDVRLKAAAKIVSEVMLKRKNHYEELLVVAADASDDASEEGYRDIDAAIKQLAESITQMHFNNLYEFVFYVTNQTEKILEIVNLSLERIRKNDLEQTSLENALLKVKAIEEEFLVMLKSFSKNTKQLA